MSAILNNPHSARAQQIARFALLLGILAGFTSISPKGDVGKRYEQGQKPATELEVGGKVHRADSLKKAHIQSAHYNDSLFTQVQQNRACKP